MPFSLQGFRHLRMPTKGVLPLWKPLGEPLDRVPPNPLLIFWKEKGVSLSADSDQRRRLWTLQAFEKA